MMKSFGKNLLRFAFLTLALLLLQATGLRAETEDEAAARGFIEKSGALIYGFAWPTATYEEAKIASIRPIQGGYEMDVKFMGKSGLSDTPLWMIVTVSWKDGAVQDMRVSRHNAMLAAPFSTVKSMGLLLNEIAESAASKTGQTSAEWHPGQRHPTIKGAIMSNQYGRWTTDHGYEWVGEGDASRPQWTPQKPHGSFLKIIASNTEGQWIPAPGYVWEDRQRMLVRWQKGLSYPGNNKLIASTNENEWAIYGAIGISINKMTQISTRVNTVYAGSPAARAGVKEGWHLLSINGVNILGQELPTTFAQLSGENGTIINIVFYDPKTRETIEKSLTRETVRIKIPIER